MQPASNTQFNAKLLVAEDNPVNLDIATRILETLGCRVMTADNGAVAAMLLTQEKFDLVLMDCEMPDMDGLEATKLARSVEMLLSVAGAEPRKRVPIVALTSHALDDVREKCLAAGMDDLLGKPFSKAQMRGLLHRWISELEGPATAPAHAGDAAGKPAGDVPPLSGINDAAIDRTVMDALLESQGSAGFAFLRRLLDRFADMAPKHLESLIEKYEAKQADELWRIAHNLKSGAGALGARPLYRRCAEIEKEARENGLGAVQPMLTALQTDLAVTLASLKTLAQELEDRAGAA